MIRADLALFGYREFRIEKEDLNRCVKLFLKHKISVKFVGESFVVSEWKSRQIERILSTRVKYNKSEPKGMYGFVYKNRLRIGVMLAGLISAVTFFALSGVIWDVRVEGVEADLAERIEAELSSAGLNVGARWSDFDNSDLEVKMLESSECVSWININRRGSVAYVSVIEKEAFD